VSLRGSSVRWRRLLIIYMAGQVGSAGRHDRQGTSHDFGARFEGGGREGGLGRRGCRVNEGGGAGVSLGLADS
jgi:hypothetical protein